MKHKLNKSAEEVLESKKKVSLTQENLLTMLSGPVKMERELT